MKKRQKRLLLLTGVLCALLSGCFFKSVDELYTVPQPSEEYQALQSRLSEVIALGGEYAAPQSGDKIQSVQLQDLTGDGRQEAIAFFRFPGEEKPMKIYIFRPLGEDYETMAVIEEAATAVNRVDYVQMDDEPFKEIVISWQMTSTVHALTVYSVGPSQAEGLLRTDYDSYQLCDLNQDNRQELVVFRTPPDSLPRAEYYRYNGVLAMEGTASLSVGALISMDGTIKTDYLTNVQTGYLVDRVPAVFATSSYGETGAITDVFVHKDGALRNVTMDPETGESKETIRYYTQAPIKDVDGDGIMEIPQPVPLPEPNQTGTSTVNYWLVRWRQFDAQGQAEERFTTYYNDRDGWYFMIPAGWEKHLVLSRSDLTSSGERAVIFSWREDSESEAAAFLTVYKLTGTNRTARAKRGQRFILREDETTIYAAELRDGWDSGLTETDVKAGFGVITTDWYSG